MEDVWETETSISNVRKAKKDDLESICRLSNEINAEHHLHMPQEFQKPDRGNRDEPAWAGFMDKDSAAVFVAEDKGVLVGAVSVSVTTSAPQPFLKHRSRGHIATIVVTKNHRGKGVGRALMSAAETFAKEQGAADIKLNVMEFNSDAFEFYQELGYGIFSTQLSKSFV